MNIGFDYQTQLNNPDWNVVKGFLGNGLSKNFANIQVGYETQHHTDDTHGDVTADSLVVAGLTTIQQQFSANGSPGAAGQFLTSAGNAANAYWSTLSISALGNTTVTGILTANGPLILKSTLSANGSTGTLYQVLSANSAANAYWTMGLSGTWTPVDASGASLSFTGVTATYLRLGGLVYVNAQLTYPSTASGSTALVGGLPFVNGTAVEAPLAVGASPVVGAMATVNPSANTISFLLADSLLTNANVSLGVFYLGGVYRAA